MQSHPHPIQYGISIRVLYMSADEIDLNWIIWSVMP